MTQTKATRPSSVVPRHTPSVSTPRTMAAAVGALFVVAGWIGVTSALLARPSSWPALVAIAAAGGAFGVLVLRFRAAVPLALLRACPSAGALVVTSVVLLAGDPALVVAYGGLFLFVTVDAYLFFTWRFAAAHGALATVLHLLTTQVTGQSVLQVLVLHTAFGAIGIQLGWLVRLASTVGVDSVTGLPDRRRLDPMIERAILDAERTGASLSVVLADLDGFGEVNGQWGSDRGDEILAQTATALCAVVSEPGTVYRYGSDEFLLLLPGVDGDEALALVERMREVTPLMFAAGITVITPGDTRADVTHRLVNALRQAQEDGRTVLAEPSGHGAELREAIRAGELRLHYQPIVALAGGAELGVEALVRWQRRDGTLVPPDSFIPRAERDGSIVDLGRWVLSTACATASAWRGTPGMPHRISVNVSHVELCRPGHAEAILDVCAEHGLDPTALVVELTETTLGLEDAHALRNLTVLRAAGVGVSIDDFGTGYSSLSRLHQMPVSELKIDRAFVIDMDSEDRPRPVLVAIVALAKALQLDLVAEGVETAAQAHALADLGVGRAQGYHFSRPVPAAELAAAVGPRVPCPRGVEHAELH